MTEISTDVTVYERQAAVHTTGLSTIELAVQNLEVVDDDSYRSAVAIRNDLVEREKGLAAFWKRIKDPMNSLKNAVLASEHATVGPITRLKNSITKKAEDFLAAAEREKAALDREMKKAADRQQGALLEEAELAQAGGYLEKASGLRTQAAMTVAPQLPPAIPVVAGARVTPKFETEVTDLVAFLQAIVDKKVDLMQEYKGGEMRAIVEINTTALNAVVSRKGLKLNWPGIEVKQVSKLGKAAGK